MALKKNVDEHLGYRGGLLEKPKHTRMSLRTIMRSMLSKDDSKLAKKFAQFLFDKFFSNSKLENFQIAQLIMEHMEGKPTQLMVEMAGPENVFEGVSEVDLLQIAGLHLIDDETGKVRPKEVVKAIRKKKKQKSAKRKRRGAIVEESEGE